MCCGYSDVHERLTGSLVFSKRVGASLAVPLANSASPPNMSVNFGAPATRPTPVVAPVAVRGRGAGMDAIVSVWEETTLSESANLDSGTAAAVGADALRSCKFMPAE